MMFRFTCLLVIFGVLLDGIKALYLQPGGYAGPQTVECKDRDPSCSVDAKNGLCDVFGENYKTFVCPLSCGVCGCKDLELKSICQSHKKRDLCNRTEYNTMCRETCGLCGKSQSDNIMNTIMNY
ncbi:shTK domain protein [Ostertagia ostertagi]